MNSLSYHIADYVEGMGGWSHIATVRPYNWSLDINKSSDLMKNMFRYKSIRKVFWVLEKDTSGKNHLHLLIDYVNPDTDLKALKCDLNKMMGYSKKSSLVQHVDIVQEDKVKGAINYACKYINTNSAYGFEV